MTRVTYLNKEGDAISVEELAAKIIDLRIMTEEESDQADLDVNIANQAVVQVIESQISETIEGLILIDPKAVSIMAALVFLGLKLKGAESNNNLRVIEEE
jgi:hypothetical protein